MAAQEEEDKQIRLLYLHQRWWTDIYAVLECSASVPFLESKQQANSFLEICRHSQVYRVIKGRVVGRLGECFKHCACRYYQGH